jgi:hypothetical protein
MGEIVGNSAATCDFDPAGVRAFLWENGHIIDLNAFVPPGSDLLLREADFINDNGDITGPAVMPNGDVHQYLLLRCGQQDSDGCQNARAPGALRMRNMSALAVGQSTSDPASIGAQRLRARVSRVRVGVKK